MRDRIRPRLTYANAVATAAAFLALGGGAYALSGVPDRSGVFHGCASNRNGALRVVASARSCHTVKRRHWRVVDPGETAISWNQQGRPGANGANGAIGSPGATGPQGPGATAFSTTLPADNQFHALGFIPGIAINGIRTSSGNVKIELDPTTVLDTFQASGTLNNGTTVSTVDFDASPPLSTGAFATPVDLDVVVRSANAGKFERLDLHGAGNGDFWGVLTPTS